MRPQSRQFAIVVTACGMLLGLGTAWMRVWLCDDAFISFRYARHLVDGQGLVFNPGEHVEGFTNLSWTLWTAAGMWLGVAPETWSVVWGMACHAATLLLLLHLHRRLSSGGLPVALLVFAVHPDAAVWATSGLETSLFSLLVLATFCLALAKRPAAAGAIAALAALTRPEGMLFAAVFGGGLMALSDRRLRAGAAFAAAFALLWLPATAWRVSYFGHFFPNTYYAKSGDLAWYSQGWYYVESFFRRSWPLALGLAFALATRRPARATLLAAAATLLYLFYLVRVGGDFMYARLVMPVVPLLAVLLEIAVARLRRPVAAAVATLAAMAGVALTPAPATGDAWYHGIADEWEHYTFTLDDWAGESRRRAAVLHRYFDGLPITMAFMGREARIVYYAEPRVAIEAETGLTDAAVAHQRLERRGRVGHEKHATPAYLVEDRRALLILPQGAAALDLDAWIPDERIHLDDVDARLLTWDPPLLEALRARGARIPDVPARIDDTARGLDALSRDDVEKAYAKLRHFYFEKVPDPARERPFLERLR